MAAREASADEWMYDLHDNNKKSEFSLLNDAFNHFLEGMVCEADEQLVTHLQLDALGVEGSVVAEHLANLLKEAKAKGGSEGAEYGRQYANRFSDYYVRCALPLGADVSVDSLH